MKTKTADQIAEELGIQRGFELFALVCVIIFALYVWHQSSKTTDEQCNAIHYPMQCAHWTDGCGCREADIIRH